MKMNEKIQIWNVLHDGKITAVQQDGETLTMFVSIPYLRRRMKPIGDSFVLTLTAMLERYQIPKPSITEKSPKRRYSYA